MQSLDELNLRHLLAAVTICDVGSISACSKVLHLSQPAITHALRKLEKQLGHKFYERYNQGMKPTAAGELFFPYVQDGLNRIATAIQTLRQNNKLKPFLFPERYVSYSQLHAFLAVLEAGSYSGAARKLGLSQPSIYRSVRDLGQFLEIPLFLSNRDGLLVGSFVWQFAEQIQLALACILSGLDELSTLQDPGIGRIAIGSLPLAHSALLPGLLARFSDRFPKAAITVAEGLYTELLSQLRRGDIDFIFGALRTGGLDPNIEQTKLFTDELFVVGRSNHPAANICPSPSILARYPWVVASANSPSRHVWEAFFQAEGLALPVQSIETGSVLLARNLMCNGDWLTLMSPYQFELEEKHGVLTRIGPPVPGSARPIGLTIRQNWRPTSLQTDFLNLTRDSACCPP
ncbi:LysR substrate-binding domain-containing protein [Acidocella sp.]|uniref:LysR substrate-binding domain-containing protein n=1 Tax=Acidocella sp. TaxID=50710 RepID=UPI003D0644C4